MKKNEIVFARNDDVEIVAETVATTTDDLEVIVETTFINAEDLAVTTETLVMLVDVINDLSVRIETLENQLNGGDL